MKSYFLKFGLIQIWFVVGDYVFFGKELALFTVYFFLIVDLACLIAYIIRQRKGNDVKTSICTSFDVLPFKWLGIGAFLEAICWIHWEENSVICAFLLVTVLLGYIFDTMDRYKKWKVKNNK